MEADIFKEVLGVHQEKLVSESNYWTGILILSQLVFIKPSL